MKRLSCLLLVSLMLASPLHAQTTATAPVTTNNLLTWENTEWSTAVSALALTYTLEDNGGGTTTVTSVACADGSPVKCQARLTAALVQMLNVVGTHAITLKAANSAGLQSGPSDPFILIMPNGCYNGSVITAPGGLWTFTVPTSTKGSYTKYVTSLGGWTLLASRSSSGGNWLLQFRCDR